MTDNVEHLLRISERKVLRKINGQIRNVDRTRKIRMNSELDQIIGGADVVRHIKSLHIE